MISLLKLARKQFVNYWHFQSNPAAIFCHNDAMAIGAIQEAEEVRFTCSSRPIPIVGFDDIQFAQYYDPPLTTISQPRYEIGHLSV
ncbi:substrate-binding domain-containing protein [Vibrio lentus]|nr:substrate-binding domain-containing protein [Vibrio lentus]